MTYIDSMSHISSLLTPLIFLLGSWGHITAFVQILHEPEEGQFIEENLRNFHQEVLSAVLQSPADKFTQRVLVWETKTEIWTVLLEQNICHWV